MRSTYRFLLPAVGWFILSLILLTLPGSVFPKDKGLALFFEKVYFDKWVHIGLFAILVVLTCWCIYKKNSADASLKKKFLIAAFAALAYGIVMEFVQRDYIPNRSFDVGDIIADGVGAVAGYLFSSRRYIKK